MKLLERICILVLCGVVAYALPKIEPSIQVKAPSGVLDIYEKQAACQFQYESQQQFINEQIQIQTNECVANVNANTKLDDIEINTQIDMARNNLTNLQTNLFNCSSISDNLGFVTCVNHDYNTNQALLNNAHSITVNMQNQLDDSLQNDGGSEPNCFGHVLMVAGKNFTDASTEYNKCMNDIFKPWTKSC